YFPGGMGEFECKKNEFLVFEDGPSMDVILQWATYKDASDQCSLSRIWGGIHPPADDIPGRKIGEKVGKDAYIFATPYFTTNAVFDPGASQVVYPNPVQFDEIYVTNTIGNEDFRFFDMQGRLIPFQSVDFNSMNGQTRLHVPSSTSTGLYILNWGDRSELMLIRD
ncbi:MAG: T9SS type A sorting domain-containing protein, partial [Flavobacteriaceae bacterium]|nr:T9SS type A sorting domain-containing protein [Flavobacteriaceae bacterium]